MDMDDLYYRHILLAADLSEQSANVARKARHLAQTFRANLSVIHVLDNIPMPDTAYGTMVPLDQDSSYEMLETAKSRLKQLCDEFGVEASRRWMVWGVPGEEIVRIAEQERSRSDHSRLAWAPRPWACCWDRRQTVFCIMLNATSWRSACRMKLHGPAGSTTQPARMGNDIKSIRLNYQLLDITNRAACIPASIPLVSASSLHVFDISIALPESPPGFTACSGRIREEPAVREILLHHARRVVTQISHAQRIVRLYHDEQRLFRRPGSADIPSTQLSTIGSRNITAPPHVIARHLYFIHCHHVNQMLHPLHRIGRIFALWKTGHQFPEILE